MRVGLSSVVRVAIGRFHLGGERQTESDRPTLGCGRTGASAAVSSPGRSNELARNRGFATAYAPLERAEMHQLSMMATLFGSTEGQHAGSNQGDVTRATQRDDGGVDVGLQDLVLSAVVRSTFMFRWTAHTSAEGRSTTLSSDDHPG